MCGICGVVNVDGTPITQALLKRMNDSISHRGPDGEGYYCGENVGLAMRRLSIIDLAGSDQPLYNEDRSIAVMFNGEIYNYRQLRHDLAQQGHTFHTEGDGETIAHLYEQYGCDAPKHMRGMFAFALWDSKQRRLFIARDCFGKKPLYYYHDANTFVFGSEIKALLNHPSVPRESLLDNPHHLALYLGYGYIPAPITAFKGIQMLMPGHYLTITVGDTQPHIQSYWEVPIITGGKQAKLGHINWGDLDSLGFENLKRKLLDLIRESVELRMIADVPLGAFLSGGLDSSLIVAFMQQMTNHPVKTFSIGFEGDDSFDETPYAQQVADYLHTDHMPFIVKPEAISLLEKLVWHHDQPFADSSAIPTFLVSELTRKQVTVALTGDGGDELFAGYERFYAATMFERLQLVPRPIWQGLNAVVGMLPEGTSYRSLTKRAVRFTQAATQSPILAYFDLVRLFNREAIYELTGQADTAAQHFETVVTGQGLSGLLRANQMTYLPDDLLIKTDRCSMAASLEARSPFLDHNLAEFVANIPIDLKLKGKTTKYILKEAARGLLPDSIIDRKKHGFGVPLGAWLRKDIAPVKDILLSDTARQRKLLNMPVVERLIADHESGKRDHNRQLWTLLTLEQWHRSFIDNFAVTAQDG